MGAWLAAGALCALPLIAAANTEPALVPRPHSLQLGAGVFRTPQSLQIRAATSDLQPLGEQLAARLVQHCGRRAETRAGAGAGEHVRLALAPQPNATSNEAYGLRVDENGLQLSAAHIDGLRHATTTALLLLCDGEEVPALQIEDAPRFAWRGAMLDSARHYQTPAYLRRFIDAMALHKLNVLHWHLTDDQAWRLEIRKYPKLTSVGAWRVPAGAAQHDLDPATGAPRRYGGFYSQREVRELVSYAAARGITIVPEIEMPGHASAAIAAYPWLGATPGSVAQVPADWGIYPNAFALDERTFGFLQDVLRETIELFPSRYVHVGGDEVEPGQWQQSATGRALAAQLGEGQTLQSHFTGRIAKFLEEQGRRLVGWDEILAPGLAQQAVVMSWRGSAGARQAAARGHDAVLAVWPTLYFDNRQDDGPEQPPGRVRTIGLRDVYGFEALPADMPAAAHTHVLGVQGNLWTEHIRTPERVDAMGFPRLAAVAELGWTEDARRNWEGFIHRLPVLLPHYRALGIEASDAAYAPRISARYGEDRSRATVSITTPEPVGEIRYTLDGSDPGPDSPRYRASLLLPLPAEVRAAAFLEQQALSRTRRVTLDAAQAQRRSSRELTLCSEGIGLMLEDDAPPTGARAVFSADIQNPCWIFERAELDRVVAVEARVGQVPFNFQIGAAREGIRFPVPRTRAGELLLYRGRSCEGEPVLRLPLAPAVTATGVTTLPRAAWPPQQGSSDLCLRFAQKALEPLWLLDSVWLVER